MPRSLYGRAALILLLPVVSLQLIVSVAFIQRHFATVTEQLTSAVVLELAYLDEAVSQAEAPQTTLRALGRAFDVGVRFVPADTVPEADAYSWFDLTARRVMSELHAGLDGLAAVALPDDRRVVLWLETGAGVVEARLRRDRLSAPNPHQLLVIIVVLGAFLSLISFLFLRNQLRPIYRLGQAAEAFGKGRHLPYKPAGANEVRAAGAAFLDMRARIERHIEQRTLMLSGVSHDLRTPLTRLKLGLSMLDSDEREPLERDVEEMKQMIDAFLEFSRGAAEGEAERVEPRQIVAQIVEDFARMGVNVELGVVEETGPVRLRGAAVRRAIENLIRNAVRYGNRAVVSITTTERSLCVSVEDDGPGIPEEHRADALRPFTRLDPGRNQNRGAGVGLGLAIAADVARAHGGSLRLGESEALGGLRADLWLGR
ncbi:ATP-binding protein [Poseidonocella sedimentorum]